MIICVPYRPGQCHPNRFAVTTFCRSNSFWSYVSLGEFDPFLNGYMCSPLKVIPITLQCVCVRACVCLNLIFWFVCIFCSLLLLNLLCTAHFFFLARLINDALFNTYLTPKNIFDFFWQCQFFFSKKGKPTVWQPLNVCYTFYYYNFLSS